jgi:hypothetical protein
MQGQQGGHPALQENRKQVPLLASGATAGFKGARARLRVGPSRAGAAPLAIPCAREGPQTVSAGPVLFSRAQDKAMRESNSVTFNTLSRAQDKAVPEGPLPYPSSDGPPPTPLALCFCSIPFHSGGPRPSLAVRPNVVAMRHVPSRKVLDVKEVCRQALTS